MQLETNSLPFYSYPWYFLAQAFCFFKMRMYRFAKPTDHNYGPYAKQCLKIHI